MWKKFPWNILAINWKHIFPSFLLLLGGFICFDVICHFGAEILWHQEVNYLRVYLNQLLVRGLLWMGIFAIASFYLLGNLYLAKTWQYQKKTLTDSSSSTILPRYSLSLPQTEAPSKPTPFKFYWLVPAAFVLSLLVEFLLWHYGQIAISYWQNGASNLNPIQKIPARFQPEVVWQLLQLLSRQIWYWVPIFTLSAILLRYSWPILNAIAIILSGILAQIASQHWAHILQFLRPSPFNANDAVFQQDISFYIFTLPIWQLVEFIACGLFLYAFISVFIIYLLSGNSLSEGKFIGFSWRQKRHLYVNSGTLMLAIALSFWLSRYELLYSPRGVTFGASFTDINAQLPIYTFSAIVTFLVALYFLGRAVFWPRQPRSHRSFGLGLMGLLVVLGIAAQIIPILVQYLMVQPNEFAREEPYIKRTIAMTRQAFNLDNINAETFNPQAQLTKASLEANDLTIRNIRLWDQRPLLETNRQLQQIRPYYRFPDADIDRYNFPSPDNERNTRQVLIAARELDYRAIPQKAQTWINRHLLYTHGYGFTMSPVNTVASGGLPEYFVKDIGTTDEGGLNVDDKSIRDTIPTKNPRIYFGEITDNYVMTDTKQRELDYPSGSDNVYTTYGGKGGIKIGSWWRRIMFAEYLKDWRMVVTTQFKPKTKVLFRRNINRRIRSIAPFLRYDSDPYLVVAKTGSPNHLFWIVDAYTTSSYFPYSDVAERGISYIRNSVKVVVDAYDGSVQFYIADKTDPIIQTWSAIYPSLFQPLNAMPVKLRQHLRYPIDYFKIQAERLMAYHMTDAQVFYNREDQWEIPSEVYGSESQLVEPYYLITSLPKVDFEEFILLIPYTPRQRNNLIAWLAARSDGDSYGKLLLYNFPKQRLIFGPEQIEARINQDPVISQQISLWNRQGSKAIQGNLLIIPVEQSLLYVEPLYLEATQNRLPTLVRVIVAYKDKIVMAPTLEEALDGIFQDQETPANPIIRTLSPPEAPE